MIRSAFVGALAAATASPRPRAGVFAEVTVAQPSTDLLDPFTVSISLHNTSTKILPVDFPTTDYYRIDILHNDEVVWSSATLHKAIAIARRYDAPPGTSRLANNVIDDVTNDRRAYAPGHYIVRVTMLGAKLDSVLDRPIEFAPPMPIARALKVTPGKVITIGGTVVVESGSARLKDESGSIRLSQSLGLHPAGPFVVRGAIETLGTEVQFAVGRFAPAFDNVPEPKPS